MDSVATSACGSAPLPHDGSMVCRGPVPAIENLQRLRSNSLHQQGDPLALVIKIVDVGGDICGARKHAAGGKAQVDDEPRRLLASPALCVCCAHV